MNSERLVDVPMTSSEFDVNRWQRLVSLLSMDVVRPFFDQLGLRLGDPNALQRVFRHGIVAARKGSTQRGPDQPLAASELVRQVAESLGAGAGDQLVWWNRNVFDGDPRDNMALRDWNSVLQTCVDEPSLWDQLGLLDPINEQAASRFRRSLNIDEYKLLQQEVDARPLSDWDLHLYALNFYDDNLYEPGYENVPDGPRLWIVPTVRSHKGYQFWDWLLKGLRSEQRDRLWHEARRLVAEEELRWVRDLPHPSVLEIWP